MKLEPKRKIYLSLAIFGIITILLIVLIIYPLFKEIQKNSEEFISQKKKLILLREEIKSLKEIRSLFEIYQTNIDKIDDLFANPEVPIEFINFLEKNAQVSQQEIEISLVSQKEVKDELWPSLSFQVSTFGSFSNFLIFLEKLENSPYLIEVLNLNIKKLTEREIQLGEFQGLSPGDVKFTFLIKVFAKK